MNDDDLRHLHRCVDLADEAVEAGDHASGSVLVSGTGGLLASLQASGSAVSISSEATGGPDDEEHGSRNRFETFIAPPLQRSQPR